MTRIILSVELLNTMRPMPKRLAGSVAVVTGAYSGRWETRGNEVVHDVEQSLFPNWKGNPLVRTFQTNGNLLTLSTGSFFIHGIKYTAVLVWQRDA